MTPIVPPLVVAQSEQNPVEFWAVLVTGDDGNNFLGNADYMYHVISEHYAFDDIYYLHVNTSIPGVDALATKENLHLAFQSWLANKSDNNDLVFIYFNTHGGGWFKLDPGGIFGDWGGLPDSSPGDEGPESPDPYDEVIFLQNQTYSDDALRDDLKWFTCGKLVIASQACFSGGFIEDISREERTRDRIVMTATEETNIAFQDLDGDYIMEWSEAFIDALHGEDTHWDATERSLVHEGVPINGTADEDGDGRVSMREVYNYMLEHDDAAYEVPPGPYGANIPEEPWLDDNGNGYPRYDNHTNWYDDNDGLPGGLADTTWFPHRLLVSTRETTGAEIPNVDVQIDDIQYYSPVPANVSAGNHTVVADMSFTVGNYEYTFDHWDWNNSISNTITVPVLENMQITAYYDEEYIGPPSGCPFVYTWSGTSYVIDNNLLPASEWYSGSDVEDYYRLEQTLVPKYEGQWFSWHSLQIREFEQEHSYFDQVKLLAVDHEPNVHVATTPTGEILTFQDPSAPISVVNNEGSDVPNLLQEVDGNYYEWHTGDYLLLDFGNLSVEEGAKLVMRADGEKMAWSIHVQVQYEDNNWNTVATVLPRVYWATEIVDLHGYLPDVNGNLKVRLYFTSSHKIDYVGLDTSEQADFVVHNANLVSASHSQEGCVLLELLFKDNYYAELVPGEHITLTFVLPKQGSETRTFVIYTKGHYFTI